MRNSDSAVPAEGNGDLQTLICVLVARPRRCPTLSNPVPWQNWMAAYLLHSADKDAVSWLTSYGSWHTYEKKKKSAVQRDTFLVLTADKYLVRPAEIVDLLRRLSAAGKKLFLITNSSAEFVWASFLACLGAHILLLWQHYKKMVMKLLY